MLLLLLPFDFVHEQKERFVSVLQSHHCFDRCHGGHKYYCFLFLLCLVLDCCIDLHESGLTVALVTDDRCSLWTGDVGCLHALGALNQIKLDLQTRVCASGKSERWEREKSQYVIYQ